MKKLAIVGTHPDTRDLAPWDDLDWEIWVFNEVLGQGGWCKRADAVFQMHKPFVYKSLTNRCDKNHWEWLKQDHGDLRIYMQEADPEVPNSVRYPREKIGEELLLGKFYQGLDLLPVDDFYTSTIVQALALGIYLDYKVIRMLGTEMASDTEYRYQRECTTFWTGLALGRGIIVEMVSGDSIYKVPVYGYEGEIEQKPEKYEARADELAVEIAQVQEELKGANARLQEAWGNGTMAKCIEEMATNAARLGYFEGRHKETLRYHDKVTQMVAETGFGFIDRNEFEGAAAQAHADGEAHKASAHYSAGILNVGLHHYYKNHEPAYLPQIATLIQQHIDAQYNAGISKGIYDENWRLSRQIDEEIRAAGGSAALTTLAAGDQGKKCVYCGRAY